MSEVFPIIIASFQTLLTKQGIRQECFNLLVSIMSEFPHQSFTSFIIPMLRSMIEDGISDKDSALLIASLNPECLTNIILLGGVRGFISSLLPFILELLYTSSFVVTRDVCEAACDALITVSSPTVLGPSLTIRYILPSLTHKLGRNKKNLFTDMYSVISSISTFIDNNQNKICGIYNKYYLDLSSLMLPDPVARAAIAICQRLPEEPTIMFIIDRILRVVFVNIKISIETLAPIHSAIVALYGILPSLSNETVINELLISEKAGIQHLLTYLPLPTVFDSEEITMYQTILILCTINTLIDIIVRCNVVATIVKSITEPIIEFYNNIIKLYNSSNNNEYIKSLLKTITKTLYSPLSAILGTSAPLPSNTQCDEWKELIQSQINFKLPSDIESIF